MRILVTGYTGFVGKNLVTRLRETKDFEVLCFGRDDGINRLRSLVQQADAIIHLAGENRPSDISAFDEVNLGLTRGLCDVVRKSKAQVPILFASSIQAERENAYGVSKRKAEYELERLSRDNGNPVVVYRLPNIFGKWCRPNYNSVVATFCYNIARNLPIHIDSEAAKLQLVYIDDVVSEFIRSVHSSLNGFNRAEVKPEYAITVGELATSIASIKESRDRLSIDRVGVGLCRALYATFLSYLPESEFSYPLQMHIDPRGSFVEILKTVDSGQFSYFTANPGVTRGGHYHHSKSEKFLVVKGSARFGFRNISTDKTHVISTSGEKPEVVETVPGWTHDITNVGNGELVVFLWANEVFDPARPDTIGLKVDK